MGRIILIAFLLGASIFGQLPQPGGSSSGGSGSGTVNSATAGQVPYYSATGTTLSGANGTGAPYTFGIIPASAGPSDSEVMLRVADGDPNFRNTLELRAADFRLSQIFFTNSRGSLTTPTALASGDSIGDIFWKGKTSTGWANSARLHVEVADTPGVSGNPGLFDIDIYDASENKITVFGARVLSTPSGEVETSIGPDAVFQGAPGINLQDGRTGKNTLVRVIAGPTQNTNLQEWQLNAGTVLSRIDSGGTILGRASQNVASAATTTLSGGNLFHITGTTNIDILNTCDSANNGRHVTLIFDGVLTVGDANNLILAAVFVTTANDTLTLVCDGTNWYEVSRSVN